MSPQEIDLKNHEFILDFLNRTPVMEQSDLAGAVKATMAQFLMNYRVEINRVAVDSMVSASQILESQINVLRDCIIDLTEYRNRLEQGVTHQ